MLLIVKMANTEKRMRVQPVHWGLLLDFLEMYPQLLTGKFGCVNAKKEAHELWKKITMQLNALGLGHKSEDKWKTALTDWKCKVKAKCQELKSHRQKTGGGKESDKTLNEHEMRLMAILGWTAVEGDINVEESGIMGPAEPCNNTVINQTEIIPAHIEIVDVDQSVPYTIPKAAGEIIPAHIEIVNDPFNKLKAVGHAKKRSAAEITGVGVVPDSVFPKIPKMADKLGNDRIEKFQKETLSMLSSINNNLEDLSKNIQSITMAIDKNTSVLTLMATSLANFKNT